MPGAITSPGARSRGGTRVVTPACMGTCCARASEQETARESERARVSGRRTQAPAVQCNTRGTAASEARIFPPPRPRPLSSPSSSSSFSLVRSTPLAYLPSSALKSFESKPPPSPVPPPPRSAVPAIPASRGDAAISASESTSRAMSPSAPAAI